MQEKTLCQTEAWTKVSKEMDGLGKAAKGRHCNIMTVGEKEWLQVYSAIICSVPNILKPSSSSRSTAIPPNDSVFSFQCYILLLVQRNRKYTFKLGNCNWVDNKQHGAVETHSSLELSSFRTFLTKASVEACSLCATVLPATRNRRQP